MARKISDTINTVPPSTHYRYGAIRDRDETVNPVVEGTPMTEAIHGDITQFFAGLMSDAGFTYNGVPDPAVEDEEDELFPPRQLIEALVAKILGVVSTPISQALVEEAWIYPTLTTPWKTTVSDKQLFRYKKDVFGYLLIEGVIYDGTDGDNIFTLPVGYRPNKRHEIAGLCIASGGIGVGLIRIESTGLISMSYGAGLSGTVTTLSFAVRIGLTI
jgi:hypothetical protein